VKCDDEEACEPELLDGSLILGSVVFRLVGSDMWVLTADGGGVAKYELVPSWLFLI
jgi:hypothetical protein